jgi:hypothetical protein
MMPGDVMKPSKKILLAIGALLGALSTNAHALLLVSEVEPNNSFATAQDVGPHDGSIDISGSVLPSGDEDVFRFYGTAGDEVTLQTIDPNNLGYDFDTDLILWAPDQSFLAFDDDSGPYFASLINYTLPVSGYYFAEVGGFFDIITVEEYVLEIRGLTPVPEPATLSLMAIGLAGIGFARRKKV